MVDVVVVNDLIIGQGLNNVVKCVNVYFDVIVVCGVVLFGEDWMQQIFEGYWVYVQYVVCWINLLFILLLLYIFELFGVVGQLLLFVKMIVDGFDDLCWFVLWWFELLVCVVLICEYSVCVE